MPLKVAVLLAAGTGLGVIARELFRTRPRILWIVAVGVAVIVVVTAAVAFVQRLLKRRQSERFARAMTPGKVAGGGTAQVRAQREDLRRRFVEGVGKLRDHGIDSYELPWYVVVGESGGGKTELLRRCGAAGATSHGMTDPLQGVGGTLNMNWWFYNRAVILDTAGRLWEDRGNATSLAEWEEFLHLLVKYRRATPVNGLILVIPATSLLRDRADEIEAKTATIVEQLHRVRNALEVRFPVYVVVSKCDLIPGFREFFEQVTQPDLQHQILGWSNRHDIDQPLQLDAPVEGTAETTGPRETQLTQELNQLADQLAMRRLALLRDPTPMGPSGRRLDDVDGIFAFPEQFRRRIIPAVSQYVSKVFAAGRYDRKPLFLRGVYFTSSMREGSPLDEDLARMLGKGLDDFAADEGLPREERAYFLTDLFDQKIFREPGLVSRSITPRRQFRRYRAAFAACALVGLVALCVLTLLASRRFHAGLGEDLSAWRVAADACARSANGDASDGRDITAVKPSSAASSDYVYGADVELGDARTRVTISAYHRRLRETLEHEIRVPYLVRPFVKPAALDAVRRESQAILFHYKVVVPVVAAARARLVALGKESPAAAAGPPPGVLQATQSLLRLELGGTAAAGGGGGDSAGPLTAADFEGLMSFVLVEGTDTWRRFAERDATCGELADLFAESMRAGTLWTGLRQGLAIEGDRLVGNEAVAAGVDLLLGGYCTPQALRDSGPTLGVYAEVAGILGAWEDAEQALLAVPETLGTDRDDWLQRVALETVPVIIGRWRNAHGVFSTCTGTVQRLLGNLGGAVDADPAPAYAAALQAAAGKARAAVLGLVVRDLALAGQGATAADREAFVRWLERRLEQRFAAGAAALDDKALTAALQTLGARFLARVSLAAPADAGERPGALAQSLGDRPALFRLRQALYAESIQALGAPAEGGAGAPLAPEPADVLGAVGWLAAASPDAYRVKEAAGAVRAMIELSTAQRNTLAAQRALQALPGSLDEVMAQIGKRADRGLAKPVIPFTALQGGMFEARFSPEPAKAVLAEWQANRDQVRRLAPVLQRQALMTALDRADECYGQYVAPFCDYWLRDVPATWEVVPFADWRSAQRAAGAAKAWEVCSGLEELCGRIQDLKAAGIADLARDERTSQRWQSLAGEVETALRHVSNRTFVDQCDAVLRRWGQLPEDAAKAREALLAVKTADFERDHFVFAPGSSNTFVHRYWSALVRELLAALGRDSRAAMEPLAAGVRTYQRWPLNSPDAGPALTLDEVGAARLLLPKLALRPGDYPEGSIGAGAGATEPVLDRTLKELRQVPLPDDDAAWLERAAAVTRTIPANDRLQRACKAQFLPPRPGEAYPFSRFWTWVVVRQGGKEITQLNTADTAATFDLAWHPGEALQWSFFLYPNDTDPDKALTVEGPWAPLKMLLGGQTRTGANPERLYGPGKPAVEGPPEASRAAAKWIVPILLTDPEGHRREMGLQLTFDQAIPVEWPAK